MWLDHEVQLEQEKDSLIKTCLTLCMCLCVFPCFLRHTSGHTHRRKYDPPDRKRVRVQ